MIFGEATKRIVLDSLKISLVVGSVLNIINQWDALTGQAGVSWPHVILNFIVPFCVATYSAIKNDMDRRSRY